MLRAAAKNHGAVAAVVDPADYPKVLAEIQKAGKVSDETRFALARALWESGRDRLRARSLAEQAHDSYAKAELKTNVAEVDSWLHLHGAS